jgi:hypothetical protein
MKKAMITHDRQDQTHRSTTIFSITPADSALRANPSNAKMDAPYLDLTLWWKNKRVLMHESKQQGDLFGYLGSMVITAL